MNNTLEPPGKENTCILIPARLAANRLPNKPLLKIGKATLISHCWRNALSCDLGAVWVIAGDQAIVDHIRNQGGNSLLTDPLLPSGTDRILFGLQQIDEKHQYQYVINLQGDIFDLKADTIKRCLDALVSEENSRFDLATPVYRLTNHQIEQPSRVKVATSLTDNTGNARAVYFSRAPVPYASSAPAAQFYGHIGIYVFKRSILSSISKLPPTLLEQRERLEQLRWLEHGVNILAVQVNSAPQSIDSYEDLQQARANLAK